jgi:hypothetical protein
MPLNVFVYSFHALVVSLLEFEDKFNKKNFSARRQRSPWWPRTVSAARTATR